MPDRVKEKLVELICDAKCDVDRICNESDWCDDCPAENGEANCKEEYIADHLIAHGVTVHEWISVKDRLPEIRERVLVYHDDGMIRFGINYGGFDDVVSSIYLNHNHHTCFSKVTHWMPLPQPPKGE